MPVNFTDVWNQMVANLGHKFSKKPTYGTGTIRQLVEESDGTGRVTGAYANIDDDEGQYVDLSVTGGIGRGDKLVFIKDENLIEGEWRPHKIVRSRQPISSPNVDRKFAPPIISGADAIISPGLGGILSLADTDPALDPTGVLQACAYVNYLAISPGEYNAYDRHYTSIAYRYRVLGETDPVTGQQVDYKKIQEVPLQPNKINTALLTASMTNVATTVAISIPPYFTGTMLYNIACYWKLDDEYILGYIKQDTPTTFYVLSRGVLGSDAAAHSSGATLILISGRFLIENLRASTSSADVTYQLQLAFVDNYNIRGMWSEAYSFVTFKITEPPATPTNLTVKITKDGYKLAWTKVPNQHVKQYRVYRYTSNPANGGGDADYSSGQSIPGTTLGRIGNVNQVNWPLNNYSPESSGISAKYFCVVAEDDSGNLSLATAWTADTTAPPSPSATNITIQATAEGPKIVIATADISDRDEGWATYVLWMAGTTAGGSAGAVPAKAIVSRFRDKEYTYRADPAGLQYYQVTCEDLIGNYGATIDDATNWKRDDGAPSAPAGLAVTAVAAGFKIRWTKPSFSQIENIDYLVIRRSSSTTGASGNTDHKVDKLTDVHIWSPLDCAGPTTPATYVYFLIGAYDYNGNFSGWSTYAQDTTPPAAPSPANVRITSARGGIQVNINNSETPHLDEGWKEYYLIRSDTNGAGSNLVVAAQFSGKSAFVYEVVYTNYYWQVVSADWIGNYTAINASNWTRAQVLYPTDPRQLLPANGDFQEPDPANSALPIHWALTGLTGLTAVGTSYPLVGSMSYLLTGGSLGSSYVGGTLGASVGSGVACTALYTKTLMPYNKLKTYILNGWLKTPINLTSGQYIDVLVALNAHAVSDGSDSPNIYYNIIRFTAPAAGYTAGDWIPSDPAVSVFVPNVVGTYCRLVFIGMYASTAASLNGLTWGLDDLLFEPNV